MELTLSRKREFKNKELQKATTRIRKAGEQVRINCYKIAVELAHIHNKKLWVEDGYNDIADYALKILRLKKSMCYDLIRIGNELTAANGRESILHRPEDCKTDYTVGQLKVLLPLGLEKAMELTNEEIITPEMSVRQIQRVARYNKDMTGEPEDLCGAPDQEDSSEITLTSEIPEPPEAIFTIADGEIFTTTYFSQLSKDKLREIINMCSMQITRI